MILLYAVYIYYLINPDVSVIKNIICCTFDLDAR